MRNRSIHYLAAKLAIFAFLFIAVVSCAEETEKVDTSKSPSLLEAVRQKHRVAALGGAIIRGDHLEKIEVTGKRKNGSAEDAQTGDAFHIGSCGKAMTATVIAILVEDGKLRWDQTIGESFPEWEDEILPVYKDVTIEQLLTHRGGIVGEPPRKVWLEVFNAGDKIAPTEQREKLARAVLAVKPAAQPGTKSVYSNQGYAIAGLMAERALKMPWEKIIREKLFDPLGMASAGFGAPGAPDGANAIWGHQSSLFKLKPVLVDNPPAIAPAGTMHMTLEDWGKFVSVHLQQKDDPRIKLSAASIKKLQTPVEGSEEAFGWLVLQRPWGGRVLTFTGSNTMWYAVVWVAPEKGVAVLAATNQATSAAFPACDGAAVELLKNAGLLK